MWFCRFFLSGLLFWMLPGQGLVLAQGTMEEGDRLLQTGKVEPAIAAFDRFKQAHPDQLEPYLKTAQALLKAGRRKDAGIELSSALRMQPATGAQAVGLAEAVGRAGNPVLAVGVLEEWLKRGELGAAGWWLISDLYSQQRRFDQALSALDRYEELAGAGSEKSNLRRAMILLEKGSLEESMTAFERVVEQNPRSGDAFHGLSKVCLFGKNPEAALRMSEQAVALDNANGIYLYQLGSVLKALGRTQEAIQRLEEAERQGADAFGVAFELGDAYRRAGDMDRARNTLTRYQSLLEEKRRDQEALQLLNQGNEQLQKNDAAGARNTFSRLLQLQPENWDALDRLAQIDLSANLYDSAYPIIERMLRLDPESSEAHFLAALYWGAKRDRQQALRHGEQSKRLRPGNPPLRNLLGYLYFAAGEWERSIEEYGAAARLDPGNSVYRANLESASRRAAPAPPE